MSFANQHHLSSSSSVFLCCTRVSHGKKNSDENDTTQKSTLDCFCRRLFSCQLVALLIITLAREIAREEEEEEEDS